MIAYSYNQDTMAYIGTVSCQLDPLETKLKGSNIFLLPASATFITPPNFDVDTEECIWTGTEWEIKIKENVADFEQGELTKSEIPKMENSISSAIKNVINNI